MQSFIRETGIIAPLERANVDTDQIIPKQFLKSIKRTGFEEGLFFDWSRHPDGSPNADFVLNQPRYAGARFLVTGNNFGCGSSREHAGWAVEQAGFCAIIAPWKDDANGRVPGFADIFKNNCSKNGVLTIELSEAQVNDIFSAIAANEGLQATIDLAEQTFILNSPEERSYRFDINPAVKQNLLRGLDDIGMTLEHEASISQFEKQHNVQLAAT
ncbi:MAG: 3-isopropylmalate dehydratase small subunit [Verrucomicrobia bacterium]|nr:3-isopropylmalate dehydratase small subunit [Verrucomicrobiota bacterium]